MSKVSAIRAVDDPETTLAEVAKATGISKKSVSERARTEREGWPYNEKSVRGGQCRHYLLRDIPHKVASSVILLRIKHHQPTPAEIHAAAELLPTKAKNNVLSQATAAAATKTPSNPPTLIDTPSVNDLTGKQRDRMNARLTILSIIEEMALHSNQGKAITAFIGMTNNNELPTETMAALLLAKNQSAGKSLINKATIYRWLEKLNKGTATLAPSFNKKKGPKPWLPYLLEIYQQPQKPTITDCLRKWAKHYPEIDGPKNIRAAQREIEKLPKEISQYGRMLTRSRRAIQPFIRRTFDGLWPMDIVTVDGHLFKAYVRHPTTGHRFRPEVTTYVDIATRKAIGFSGWIAESQYAIWLSLHDMVLNPECGIPAMHYSDNGAYTGEQHRSLMARLGTSITYSIPYRAQARGVIERFNSSVWVPLAKELPLYCGKDVDQEYFQKAIKKADKDSTGLIGWEDFIQICNAGLDAYNDRPHSSLKGKTPNQAWAMAVEEGWKPTLLEGDDLHDLLPAKTIKVIRAEVKLPWGRYFSKDLALYHGHHVRVLFQPTDGSQVWIAKQDGEFICIAKRDANARPYMSESQMDHARAQREKGRVDRIERKLRAIREEGATQIEAQPLNEVTEKLHREITADLLQPAPVVELLQTPEQRYARAYTLKQRIQTGTEVSAEDQSWLISYQTTVEYKAQHNFHQDFGITPEWKGQEQ